VYRILELKGLQLVIIPLKLLAIMFFAPLLVVAALFICLHETAKPLFYIEYILLPPSILVPRQACSLGPPGFLGGWLAVLIMLLICAVVLVRRTLATEGARSNSLNKELLDSLTENTFMGYLLFVIVVMVALLWPILQLSGTFNQLSNSLVFCCLVLSMILSLLYVAPDVYNVYRRTDYFQTGTFLITRLGTGSHHTEGVHTRASEIDHTHNKGNSNPEGKSPTGKEKDKIVAVSPARAGSFVQSAAVTSGTSSPVHRVDVRLPGAPDSR